VVCLFGEPTEGCGPCVSASEKGSTEASTQEEPLGHRTRGDPPALALAVQAQACGIVAVNELRMPARQALCEKGAPPVDGSHRHAHVCRT
jgi:hypothetical protein